MRINWALIVLAIICLIIWIFGINWVVELLNGK